MVEKQLVPLVHMDGVEGLRIKFKPSEEEAQKAFDFGVEIGNALK